MIHLKHPTYDQLEKLPTIKKNVYGIEIDCIETDNIRMEKNGDAVVEICNFVHSVIFKSECYGKHIPRRGEFLCGIIFNEEKFNITLSYNDVVLARWKSATEIRMEPPMFLTLGYGQLKIDYDNFSEEDTYYCKYLRVHGNLRDRVWKIGYEDRFIFNIKDKFFVFYLGDIRKMDEDEVKIFTGPSKFIKGE